MLRQDTSISRDLKRDIALSLILKRGSRVLTLEDSEKDIPEDAKIMEYVRTESIRNMIHILRECGKGLNDLEEILNDLPRIEIREVSDEEHHRFDTSRV